MSRRHLQEVLGSPKAPGSHRSHVPSQEPPDPLRSLGPPQKLEVPTEAQYGYQMKAVDFVVKNLLFVYRLWRLFTFY
jgi:hypothetical protein